MIEERLKKIIERTDGCIGILAFSYDGFVSEEVWQKNSRNAAKFFNAVSNYAPIVKKSVAQSRENSLGDLEELFFQTSDGIFIIRPIDDEIFIAMVLDQDGNIGKGRFELKEAAFHLFQAVLV